MVDGAPPPEQGPSYGLWAVGVGALLTWFAMLWLMFGDVL